MPLYRFKNPETGEEVEVFQSMKDDHSYNDNGVDYERVFLIPNASIDAKIDGSEANFKAHLDNKKGTVGDAIDASKEAAEKRKELYGHDPVQKKFFKEYSGKRKGLKHYKDTGDTQ
jgi:hypothetical protein